MFSEFGITLADGRVWMSIGQGLLFSAGCLLFGIWVATLIGLRSPDAPVGETLSVGLGSGLVVLSAWWAAIASGGRSSFTPIAIGFAIAIALAWVRRLRPLGRAGVSRDSATEPPAARQERLRDMAVAIVGGAVFIVAVAVVYGSTLVQSPRDGVQPLEVMDTAYYSILGADLAKTGTETIYSPAGFGAIQGIPTQTWYHWGEIWLASAVITIFGTAPLDARHFVVLPLLLLGAAAMTGTLVRRMTGSTSRGAYLFGFLACLFLAPVPLIAEPHFGSWAIGLVFGITSYGLASVAVLLGLYGLAVLNLRPVTGPLVTFVGVAVAFILPAHLVIAVLAFVGIGSVWAIRVLRSLLARRRLPVAEPVWQQTFAVTAIAIVVTVTWGTLTGHGIASGSGLSPGVLPFNATWRESIALITLGAGAFVVIAVAWLIGRRDRSIEADLYVGTATLLVAGAVGWGARLADYNTFHLLFAGISVFATPVAAVAVWSAWLRLRATGHLRVAICLIVLCGAQLEYGAARSIIALQAFGPHDAAVPEEILAGIRSLPADAKLAYACQPFEELAPSDARLLGLDAHTGRRIVPMCFEADLFGQLIGGQKSRDIANPLFQAAPQHMLYPNANAQPSPASVAAFLKANGIDYIYADTMHPNALVPDATPVVTGGTVRVLRIP